MKILLLLTLLLPACVGCGDVEVPEVPIYDEAHLEEEGEFAPVAPEIANIVEGLEVYEYYVQLVSEVPTSEFVVIDFKEEITMLRYCPDGDGQTFCVGTALATTEWVEEGNFFKITLSHDALTGGYLPFIMVHEWAHVLTWDAEDQGPHGPMWGVAFSRCYQALVED